MRSARLAALVLVTLVSAMAPSGAAAQSDDGLARLLLQFFSPSNPVILRDSPPPNSHAAHFASQPSAQALLTQLNRGIASQISTFPLGSSSAGFTYTFDPALGVFNRSTETFGPVFSERPITAGKGKFSVGLNYQKATYDTFDGYDLGAGDMHLYLTHVDSNNDNTILNPWFEGDIIRADLSMDLENETTVFYANYGVSDRFDVGIAVPYQRIDLSAHIDTSIERLASTGDPFVVHVFSDGQSSHRFLESGSASGVGDIVLRGKLMLSRSTSAGLAAAVDVRVPTGDEDNLLGSGATQTKLSLIAAAGGARRFAPRGSIGYTLSSGGGEFTGDIPDELNYSAGFDAGLHKRVTLTADVIGRTLRDASQLNDENVTFSFTTRNNPTVRTVERTTPITSTGNLNLILGSAGLKINLVGHLLLVGNVLFSLSDDGLQDKVTPVFGLDYSF
jgi:hypothetical protein